MKTKQHYLRHCLCSLFFLMGTAAFADGIAIDSIYYELNLTEKTAEVRQAIIMSGDIVIPSTIDYNGESYQVTSIDNNVFYLRRYLTSISIPNSVTHIGMAAFWGCESLTSVNIPTGVTTIEPGSFGNCKSLTSINIPDGVTSIKFAAFSGCSSLTSINIPDGMTSIGVYTFQNCSSLTSITLPKNIRSIGDYAFDGCSSLASVNLPDSMTTIGEYAFKKCFSLSDINIPDGVTSINEGAFYRCNNLTSLSIPASVTRIGNYAFDRCNSLEKIVVDTENTVYDSREHCDAIIVSATNELMLGCKNTVIPESVTSIGHYAFYDCKDLTSFTIPSGVTIIKDNAFGSCTNLRHFYSHATAVPEMELDIFSKIDLENATLHVPASAIEDYRAAEQWKDFGTIVALTDEDLSVNSYSLSPTFPSPVLFDLQGRRLNAVPARGLYVKDGRKYVK